MSKSPLADADLPADIQASLLSQALPYMQEYAGKVVVIKYGGSAMGNESLGRAFARDVALLQQSGVTPIVVHGGGPQIGSMLDRVGISSEFQSGLRVTDAATIEIVEMVLAGSLNKRIVSDFNAQGAKAIGLCGKDGNMVTVTKFQGTDTGINPALDLGFVGYPKSVNPEVLNLVSQSGLIPVIAPIALGEDGQTYNVNADIFAGHIAAAMDASRLLFLTDVEGVLDSEGNLLSELTIESANSHIKSGTISGGMIPKVETCIHALENGVSGVVIVDGRSPHAVLLELFTDHGAGTLLFP